MACLMAGMLGCTETRCRRSEAATLADAISQLRKVLAPGLPVGLTTEYLVRLQNALEVAERAVRAERWAREGYEFQGE
jgi:hypothetical protein